MRGRMRIVVLGCALGLACALGLPARDACAQDYPSRPVTIVLPYTAGGAVEAVARLLGERLAQRLGRPFVIENRPGAGTGIAAAYVAHAAPDGHTLLLATSTTMAINLAVYRNLSYDPIKDLAPVALVAGVSFVLVVNPSLGIRSMARSEEHTSELQSRLHLVCRLLLEKKKKKNKDKLAKKKKKNKTKNKHS